MPRRLGITTFLWQSAEKREPHFRQRPSTTWCSAAPQLMHKHDPGSYRGDEQPAPQRLHILPLAVSFQSWACLWSHSTGRPRGRPQISHTQRPPRECLPLPHAFSSLLPAEDIGLPLPRTAVGCQSSQDHRDRRAFRASGVATRWDSWSSRYPRDREKMPDSRHGVLLIPFGREEELGRDWAHCLGHRHRTLLPPPASVTATHTPLRYSESQAGVP
jgi:hypothetical protein